MTDNVRERPIDDLDLSVRTSELLASLGVETVGQLLELPKIEIPTDWPQKTARLVAAELGALFIELEVEYTGAIVVRPPSEATRRATGSVAARWKTISSWLAEEHPKALTHFNPPASAAAIAAVEEQLSVALPDDYKQFLALHNGQRESSPMVGLGSLLAVEEIVEAKSNISNEDTPIDAEAVGVGVRAVSYCEGWIPISKSARGRDYLCIDVSPAPGGIRGQVIEYVTDSDERPLIAKSFADLLSLYFEQAQTGEIDLDEMDDDEMDDDEMDDDDE